MYVHIYICITCRVSESEVSRKTVNGDLFLFPFNSQPQLQLHTDLQYILFLLHHSLQYAFTFLLSHNFLLFSFSNFPEQVLVREEYKNESWKLFFLLLYHEILFSVPTDSLWANRFGVLRIDESDDSKFILFKIQTLERTGTGSKLK